MTERDEDGGVVYTTLWHGTLAGGMAVDEDSGENGNEYDSRLDMEMRTRTILVGLWSMFLGPLCLGPHPRASGDAQGKKLGRATHKILCIFHLSSNIYRLNRAFTNAGFCVTHAHACAQCLIIPIFNFL